ncbi:MAG: nucleotidyltransferase family protein, partial [Alphaproteobacteria bacterium]|nr:nucleotidyltransferase family protein [Alphaproteobacteria bacterium]
MTQSTPELQALLIDLVCARRPANIDLDGRDWDALMAMVRHHRLAPLLHWRLTREASAVPVPQAVRAQLASAFTNATLRALQVQRELLLVHRILESAGIPHVALKGAYLAHHCYPTP